MKKIISVLMTVLMLMTALTVWASANAETDTYVCEVDGVEYTVEFEGDALSAEKKEAIAQKLIGTEDSSVQTYGLGCTLFGHDYTYNTVRVITHKVRATAPRCQQDTYDTTGCEDCDYFEQTLVNISYIYCCD